MDKGLASNGSMVLAIFDSCNLEFNFSFLFFFFLNKSAFSGDRTIEHDGRMKIKKKFF